MRKLLPILILCLALLSGCARPLVDTRVSGVGLVGLTPTGMRTADAMLRVDVSNPGPAFTLREIHGLVKLSEEPFLQLSAEDITVDRKRDSSYVVPLHGELVPGTSILQLLSARTEWNPEEITVDFSARVSLGRGSGKMLEYKDIPLRTLLDSFRYE